MSRVKPAVRFSREPPVGPSHHQRESSWMKLTKLETRSTVGAVPLLRRWFEACCTCTEASTRVNGFERVADEPEEAEALLAANDVEVGIVESRQAVDAEAVEEPARLVQVRDAALPAVPEVAELVGVVRERDQDLLVAEHVGECDLARARAAEAGGERDAVLHHVEPEPPLVGSRRLAVGDRRQRRGERRIGLGLGLERIRRHLHRPGAEGHALLHREQEPIAGRQPVGIGGHALETGDTPRLVRRRRGPHPEVARAAARRAVGEPLAVGRPHGLAVVAGRRMAQRFGLPAVHGEPPQRVAPGEIAAVRGPRHPLPVRRQRRLDVVVAVVRQPLELDQLARPRGAVEVRLAVVALRGEHDRVAVGRERRIVERHQLREVQALQYAVGRGGR
jgi:hypothetical protein